MKAKMDDKLKHRLVGGIVVIALAVLFLPVLLKKSNYNFDKRVNISVKMPNKPQPPQVDVPSKKIVFETAKIAKVKLTPTSDLPPTPKHVKAQYISKPQARDIKLAKKGPPKKQVQAKTKAKIKANKFAVQLGIFSVKKNAVELVNKLNSKGYSASMQQAPGQHGTFYKVLVGNFVNKNKAKELQQQINDTTKINGFVVASEVS